MLEIRDFSKTYKGGKRAVDHLSCAWSPVPSSASSGPTARARPTTIRAVVGVLGL